MVPREFRRADTFAYDEGMRDFLVFLLFLAAWLVLTRWLLPKLGVPT